MAEIETYTGEGDQSGVVQVSDDIFEKKTNKRLLEIVNRMYSNNRRTTNAHTKTRAEVRGGGSKPWRQKGTGRARVSSIRSPIWCGGGTVFGPRTRDVYANIPKALSKKALIEALTIKYRQKRILILDEMPNTNGKTKIVAAVLKKIGVEGKAVLWLTNDTNNDFMRATANISHVSVKHVNDCNAYHILRKYFIILDKEALVKLQERVASYVAKGKVNEEQV